MPVRDDSVIRGGLIASSIFLVLSLIANFLFWRWGDVSSKEALDASSRLQTANATIQTQSNQLSYMKAVVGVGDLTEAEVDSLKESGAGDADMEKVIANVDTALSYFPKDWDFSQKNLSALPGYLTEQIRGLSDQYKTAMDQQAQAKARNDAELKIAKDAQAMAEQQLQASEEEKDRLAQQFEADRNAMKLENGRLQDTVNKTIAQARDDVRARETQINSLQQQKTDLLATIEDQRRELNQLRKAEYEVAQGEVTYTRPGERLVMINLGAADQLRNGVSFEVFDADETRVSDAKPKAMIEIVAIRGDHLAEARLLGAAIVNDPIIPGDKVYSPFWAPGRKIRVALAGAIDVNRDGRADASDINLLRGAIQAAGAEVAAEMTPGSGRGMQALDSGIRFLVIGERPEISEGANAQLTERQERELKEIGEIIEAARQKGITIIPAEKLIGYLKTLDESITIPLGGEARGSDFPPPRATTMRTDKQDVSGIYQRAPAGGR